MKCGNNTRAGGVRLIRGEMMNSIQYHAFDKLLAKLEVDGIKHNGMTEIIMLYPASQKNVNFKAESPKPTFSNKFVNSLQYLRELSES